MKRKTFYIVAAIWFALVLIVLAASFLPIVDEVTRAEIRKYMAWVIIAGALAMIMIRNKVDKDK